MILGKDDHKDKKEKKSGYSFRSSLRFGDLSSPRKKEPTEKMNSPSSADGGTSSYLQNLGAVRFLDHLVFLISCFGGFCLFSVFFIK